MKMLKNIFFHNICSNVDKNMKQHFMNGGYIFAKTDTKFTLKVNFKMEMFII